MSRLNTKTRQKQIIETSLELIKEGGIQRLTTKNIANSIGISEQAIYRHFNSKLEILVSIIHYFEESFKELFEQLELPESAIGQIRKLTGSHLDYFDKHPATAAVIFSEEIFQNEESLTREVREALQKRIDHMTRIIRKGQETGEIKSDFPAENLAQMLLGTMRLVVTSWRLSSFSFDLPARGTAIIENLTELIKN